MANYIGGPPTGPGCGPYNWTHSPYWVKRFGMIPNLPANFDNSNDIYELLTWIQRGLKQLMDDFANLELEFEEFKNAIIEMLEVLIPQIFREFMYSQEFKDYIYTLIWEWWNTYQEERIANIETNIANIWIEIQKIWDAINGLQDIIYADSAEYTTLTAGVDYEIGFFNGYYTEQTYPVKIGVIVLSGRYLLKVECDRLRNASVANMIQNHNSSVAEIPESAIFGVNFINNYAEINNVGTISETYSAGNALFNIYPKDIQASWQPLFQIQRDYGGYKFVNTFRSLADGWNTQYSDYISNPAAYNLDWGTFAMEMTAVIPT